MRLTLAGHAGSPDLDLDVVDGARLGDLRPDLATASGRPELAGSAGRPPAVLAVDDVVLGDEHLTGHAPLLPGAVLRTGRGGPDLERAALTTRWHLAVVGGPDSGTLVPLDVTVVLGRSPGRSRPGPAPVRHVALEDPTVSERQVEVRPGRRAPRARDLASRNGTRLARRRRPGRPVRLRRRARTLGAGDRLVLGATAVEVRSATPPAAPAPDRPRTPRVQPGTGPAGWVAPAAGALVLAAATGNRMLLALAVVGPATSLAGTVVGRCADALRTVRTTAPGGRRRVAAPPASPVVLPLAADLRTDALRRPVVGPMTTAGPAVAASPWHALAPDGCLAVTGPRPAALAVARLLACVAIAEVGGPSGADRPFAPGAPSARGIEVLPRGGDPQAWRWARWLPAAGHPALVVVDGADAAGARVRERAAAPVLVVPAEGDRVPSWCATVLTVDGDARTARLTAAGAPARTVPVAGVSTAWAERQARLLCAAGRDADAGRPAGAAVPPGVVALADLPGIPRPDGDAVLRAWAATSTPAHPASGGGPQLSAVLGRGPAGSPVTVDLVRDGPHGLVAGTTGAGKSGLLQTWVLSLALTHSPVELAVLLVDYKGGAGFGACAGLPHVAGLVTDLDAATAARALTGLRAELRRREHLLARWSVPDLAALRARSPGLAPPRLLVVVDEFRTLVDDLPGFVPDLLRVAAQGRSLGVHLLLATQRPGGAVGPDLRANLAVRVALRVTGTAESHDVVDVPDAAAIPADAVGRALLRRGPAAPEPLQVAHAEAPPARRRALVRRVDDDTCPTAGPSGTGDGGTGGTAGRPAGGSVPTSWPTAAADRGRAGPAPGVDAWVVAACDAARTAGLPRADPPWLPPLPAELALRDLARHRTAARTGGHVRLLVALADHPEHQQQTVVGWEPRCGPVLVTGAPLSGRTTVLRTLAAGALEAGWHVHVVCASAPPDGPSGHPGCGTVVGADDPRRVARLLTALAGTHPQLVLVDGIEEVLDRLATVARGRGADVLLDVLRDGRRRGIAVAATASPGLPQSVARLFTDRLVLRLDDPVAESLAGVPAQVATTTGPPGRGAWLPAGGAGASADAPAGPARCQVAHVPGEGALPAPLPAAPPPTARPGPPALRLLPVPLHVQPHELDRACRAFAGTRGRARAGAGPDGAGRGRPLDASGADAGGAWLPVGLGGDDAGPVGPLLTPGALVVGPAGSGRSTALAALARAAARGGALLTVVARDGVLRDLGATLVPERTCGHAPAAVVRVLDEVVRSAADGLVVLLVDDLDALEPRAPEVSARLADLVLEPGGADPGPPGDQAARHGRGVLVVASAQTGAATTAFRGPLAALRTLRSGLVLGATEPGSAEVFGVDLGWAADPALPHAPGRGVLVRGREVTPVQVAHAVADDRADGSTRRR